MYKNIVICLDGTGNEIETGETNILRLFRLLKNAADQETTQRVYYHPRVIPQGAKIHPSAMQRFEDVSLNWRPANLLRYLAVKKPDAAYPT
jgi:uncharacterized protein (DUF2235 family)